jgi:hypothetical protein
MSHSGAHLAQIARGFRAERNQALHRVLKGLPYDFIIGLIEGLEGADVITPGRLFAGRSGGCAVGVTLRAMDPRYRGRRIIWGRRLRRSVVALRRGLATRVARLYALEQVFDRSVRLAQARDPGKPPHVVARAVALWVADEARAELLLREMNSEWMERVIAEITQPGAPSPPPVSDRAALRPAQRCFA